MRRSLAIVLALGLAILPARALATESINSASTQELSTAKSGLSGQLVAFEGEVISERLAGGEGHVWVNVLADGVAIGVWSPEELTAEIEVFGDWGNTGDIVRVTGRFSEACDTHGGDLDVHATDIELITRGAPREHPVAYWKLAFAFSGVVVAYVAYRRMRRAEEESLRG